MNSRFILLITACTAAVALRAQPTTPPPDQPPATNAEPVAQPDAAAQPATRTPEQLDQLLGPIALYPDALVAVILPAATAPSDIVLASRFLGANGAPEAIDSQPWDDSVKSLAHYPEVVKWMDDNLEWTKELGETFVAQPADVMKAVQRLRAKAQAVGSLKTTPQQQVVMQGPDICIVPAQPDVIYVPSYDPGVVYVVQPAYYTDPFLTFGVGFAVGSWLYYDCDWGQRVIWVGSRSSRGGWRPPTLYARPHYANNPDWRHWRPSPRARINNRPSYYHPRQDVVQPRPYTAVSPRPSWPRNAVSDPRAVGPQNRGVRDNPVRPAGPAREPWPRLTNQGSRLQPAPGTVSPQAVSPSRPPGGRPASTPAPDIYGPRNGNYNYTPPAGGRANLPAPGAGAPQSVREPAPSHERPTAAGPARGQAPHARPAASHPQPAPRAAPAPNPRPVEKDKNQN